MKKLHFIYSMELLFEKPVCEHRFTLKCTPLSNNRQVVNCTQTKVEPELFLSRSYDAFGNDCIYGYEKSSHDAFSVYVEGTALTGLSSFECKADETMLGIYRYPSALTKPKENILAYFSGLSLGNLSSALDKALYIMNRVHEDITYAPGVTSVNTCAEEALSLRQGVCQDYSHIMISLCRLAGVPARYVVGMMMGEGESHAWVEICDGGNWIALDPTNDLIVNEDHIKISCGRDYKDCRINHGVFIGKTVQTQKISVNVEERV